ncbi:MAG: RecQ family ATP-dependent DNA helicase [Alphaproteobacteria bacterium]|nr:RecQ family ATP-dependent DNA helicase [Alphaproteobacteria bacterium]
MATTEVMTVLRERFGFDRLLPGQAQVIEALLAGRSALAVFPTGGGKSLCYQLPALCLDGVTLVVSPLIALMKDQIDALQARGIAAARIDSSLDAESWRAVWDDLDAGRLRLLYVAPERFGNERFLSRIRRLDIALMAIDEAHCISEWGHNFRPDYLKLARLVGELGVQRVVALTATATPAVADQIAAAFAIAPADRVVTGFHRPNLFLRATAVTRAARDAHLVERVRALSGSTIVYVTLQHTAVTVAKRLVSEGFEARAYHAGMKTEERVEVQEAFMAGQLPIVVATIAFGMGIDKSDIRNVLHYNLPKALENYAQEIGRAGRDGAPSTCELFAAHDDVVTLQNFTYGDTPTPDAVRGIVRELLSQGERFDVSQYELSRDHDVRPLVVATLLTYLELEGVLAATAPFYASYQLQPHRPSREILDARPNDARLLGRILSCAKKGRTWFTLDIDEAAAKAGVPRQEVVSAMEGLAHAGDVTLKVSGLRHGYRRVRQVDPDALAAMLTERFQSAEQRDLARIEGVLGLATRETCLTAGLLAYFGEPLEACGHCDRCAGEPVRALPPAEPVSFGPGEEALVREVRAQGHDALASARQLARFLCGLPSPAVGRAKLRSHPRFGALGDVPFAAVLELVEAVG